MEHDAPPHRRWADLDVGPLLHIAERCTVRDYAFFRAACAEWRSQLLPPTSRPFAPVLPAHGATRHQQPVSFAAWGLLAKERWYPLTGLRQPSGLARGIRCRCVGARDGWVALALDITAGIGMGALLFNPVTGAEIPLDTSLWGSHGCDRDPKVVFSLSPSPRDFAAVCMCGPKRLAVERSCDRKGGSVVLAIDTNDFMGGAILADVAYCDDGTVYCLTGHGGVQVLQLNLRPRGCLVKAVEVKPLLAVAGTDVFPPPFDTISRFTDAKSLVLCDGVLYQMWRRPRGAGSVVDVPTGGGGWRPAIRIVESDVFVLRYDPGRWPCWSEAKDLGGYAVFIGKNNAAAVRVDAVMGLRADCVYYWDRRPEGDYEAVVYDMETRRSARVLPVDGGVSSPLWYFLPACRKHVDATMPEEDMNVEVN